MGSNPATGILVSAKIWQCSIQFIIWVCLVSKKICYFLNLSLSPLTFYVNDYSVFCSLNFLLQCHINSYLFDHTWDQQTQGIVSTNSRHWWHSQGWRTSQTVVKPTKDSLPLSRRTRRWSERVKMRKCLIWLYLVVVICFVKPCDTKIQKRGPVRAHIKKKIHCSALDGFYLNTVHKLSS